MPSVSPPVQLARRSPQHLEQHVVIAGLPARTSAAGWAAELRGLPGRGRLPRAVGQLQGGNPRFAGNLALDGCLQLGQVDGRWRARLQPATIQGCTVLYLTSKGSFHIYAALA